jgi:hypothetical protein
MLIKTNNRFEAYTAVINECLKDPQLYCNNCGKTFFTGDSKCCDDPQIGDNAGFCSAIIKQNIETRELAKNCHASFENNAMRHGLSLPPFLYEALKNYEARHGAKFLDSKDDINWFMRKFPQFCIPRRV